MGTVKEKKEVLTEELVYFLRDSVKWFNNLADESADEQLRTFSLEMALEREAFLKEIDWDMEDSEPFLLESWIEWLEVKGILLMNDKNSTLDICIEGEKRIIGLYKQILERDEFSAAEVEIYSDQLEKVEKSLEYLQGIQV